MSAIPESFVSNISIRERLTGIEKRLGKGEFHYHQKAKQYFQFVFFKIFTK